MQIVNDWYVSWSGKIEPNQYLRFEIWPTEGLCDKCALWLGDKYGACPKSE